MTPLDGLLAEPVDVERNRVRSLPLVLFGVLLPVATPCGIVSRSAQQTADAIARARRAAPALSDLTNADFVWLLLNGWTP